MLITIFIYAINILMLSILLRVTYAYKGDILNSVEKTSTLFNLNIELKQI